MDRLHDLAPQNRRRVGSRNVDLLGLVIADPDRRRVVAGVAAEPTVPVGGGGAGLAGDGLPIEDCRAAGSVVGGIVQAVVHIIHSFLTEDLPAVLGIVHHQLAVAVIHLGIQPGFPVNAVVGEGGVGRGHLLHRGTHGQGAQGQRGQAHIGFNLRFRGEPLHQVALTEVILGEAVAILLSDIVQRADRNGVDGGHDALIDCSGVLVFPVVVLGPVAVGIADGQVLEHRSRSHLAGLKGRGVHRNGLLGGAGLEFRLGGPVVAHEGFLLSHAAGQGHHVAGTVVDDHNGGLELLVAAGFGNVGKVGIDGVHLLLHIHVQSGVNMVAALLNPVQVHISGVFIHGVPGLSVLLRQIRSKINDHRVHIPGIDVLRSIGGHPGGGAADGTVALVSLSQEGAAHAGVAALPIVADRPAISIGDALLKDHLLIHGLLIFFVGEVALIVHFAEDIELTVAVPPRAVPFLALVLIDAQGIGIEQRGVVGDADEAGALGGGQALQLLAEILRRRAFDAVAAPAQIDLIEVILHNEILVVLLFEELGTENLHDLPLHGDALFLGQVLHQLLGDGGATELLVSAKEHIEAGLDGGNPVHTLMLIKPLVLNGYRRVDHGLGNLVQRRPLAVGGGVDLLKLLDISAAVYIIDKGSPLQVVVLHGPVAGLLQDVVLKIVAQRSNKHRAADQKDQQNRGRRANGDLHQRHCQRAAGIEELNQPVRVPLLPGLLPSPFEKLFFCHRDTSVNAA